MTRTALVADDPRHGTWNAYTNHGCLCLPCRRAGKRQRQFGHDEPRYQHGGQAALWLHLVTKGVIP